MSEARPIPFRVGLYPRGGGMYAAPTKELPYGCRGGIHAAPLDVPFLWMVAWKIRNPKFRRGEWKLKIKN